MLWRINNECNCLQTFYMQMKTGFYKYVMGICVTGVESINALSGDPALPLLALFLYLPVFLAV